MQCWRSTLGILVPPTILLHVFPTFAMKTVSSKVLGFDVVLTFAFEIFAFSSFTQHREIQVYSIRLCLAVIKHHRPDLCVTPQDMRVQVAVVLHLKRC